VWAGYSAATVSICLTHGNKLNDFLSDRIASSLLRKHHNRISVLSHQLVYLLTSLAICLSANPYCLANNSKSFVISGVCKSVRNGSQHSHTLTPHHITLN